MYTLKVFFFTVLGLFARNNWQRKHHCHGVILIKYVSSEYEPVSIVNDDFIVNHSKYILMVENLLIFHIVFNLKERICHQVND